MTDKTSSARDVASCAVSELLAADVPAVREQPVESRVDDDHATIDTFREVMATVPAPVAIVTASQEGDNHGATVSAFCSLSMDPPMMLVALGNSSSTLAAIAASGRFGVNLMGSTQVDVCNRFARNGADKFSDTDWELDHGVPHLADVPGFIACEVTELVVGGDHTVIFGHVLDASMTPSEAILYYKRNYAVATHLT